MQVNLTGVTDIQYVTVQVQGVASADGGTGGIASARIGFLAGDVDGSRNVSPLDVRAIALQNPTATVDASNYLLDINVSGTISPLDLRGAALNILKSLPTP
jgi:hypothetical protein